MTKTKYSVTRYNKTRYFALTADGELMAVTVYRKGALNIINHINTIMAKKHNHTVKAVDLNGITVRIMLNSNGELEICTSLRGEFKAEQVLPNGAELLTNGSYTPADEKHAKLLKRMLNKQQNTTQTVEDTTPEEEIAQEAPAEQEREAPAAEPVEEPAPAPKPARAKACQYMMPGDPEPRNVEHDTKTVPGMTLIRKHKGKTVTVKVLDHGFEWEGTVYPTLTHVSWKAADYHISGNAYFGLAVPPRNK